MRCNTGADRDQCVRASTAQRAVSQLSASPSAVSAFLQTRRSGRLRFYVIVISRALLPNRFPTWPASMFSSPSQLLAVGDCAGNDRGLHLARLAGQENSRVAIAPAALCDHARTCG